jgi:hypothetical protein
MVSARNLSFTSASIAAGIILVVAGGLACHSADAADVASGMKAKMKLPVQVDDDTRLDDVRATAKKELGYFLTLTRMTKAQADANSAFGNLLESNLRGSACQNPNYQTLMKAGLSVRVTYASSDQVEIRKIVIAPSDCKL